MVQNAETAGRTESDWVRLSTRYEPARRRITSSAMPATMSPIPTARISRRRRPGTSQRAIAQQRIAGTQIQFATALRPWVTLCAVSRLSARSSVIWAAFGGRLWSRLPRKPNRSPSWTTRGRRSRTTFPLVVSRRGVWSSSTRRTCSCASDDASTNRFCTRGRASSSCAPRSIASRPRPASGAARGWRLSGNRCSSMPATSTFA